MGMGGVANQSSLVNIQYWVRASEAPAIQIPEGLGEEPMFSLIPEVGLV